LFDLYEKLTQSLIPAGTEEAAPASRKARVKSTSLKRLPKARRQRPSALVDQMPVHVFVQQARCERLVGNAFLQGARLKVFKVAA
jgi:hypothetical protein